MELFTAIAERRSCRNFSPEPIAEELVLKILEAASWAPSPLNAQPWEFIVITSADVREKTFAEGDRCRKWAFEKSGWKWMESYSVDFLRKAPCIIAVVGDPKKTGADMFMEEGGSMGYQQACAAAIQNMLLAAHSLKLGSLWYTLFDRNKLREILNLDSEKIPLALVLLGKSAGPPQKVPRKGVEKKTRFVK